MDARTKWLETPEEHRTRFIAELQNKADNHERVIETMRKDGFGSAPEMTWWKDAREMVLAAKAVLEEASRG